MNYSLHALLVPPPLAGPALRPPVVEHVSVQYTNRRTGAVEEAWCDPILGESSDLRAAKRAGRWG